MSLHGLVVSGRTLERWVYDDLRDRNPTFALSIYWEKIFICYVLFIISLCTYVYKGRSIKYSLCKHLYPSIHFNDNCWIDLSLPFPFRNQLLYSLPIPCHLHNSQSRLWWLINRSQLKPLICPFQQRDQSWAVRSLALNKPSITAPSIRNQPFWFSITNGSIAY